MRPLRFLETVRPLQRGYVVMKRTAFGSSAQAYRAATESSLRLKLRTYYRRKQKAYAESFTDLFDADLHQLFLESTARKGRISADKFLRQRRRNIVRVVCQWTCEPKYRVNEILGDLIERTGELDLTAEAADSDHGAAPPGPSSRLIVPG